ncbi:MAG: hypothetical protein QOJ09_1913 [Actinomycetota bacterium]|jgi:hypothetical protein|nr:hypothetical protein [Actinomycetota bacterium]
MEVDDRVRRLSRRLRDLVEPIAANVYFAEEAQKEYAGLGLNYPQGYFSSRGACMGQVPGEVVAAAFGVFHPPMVVGFVDDAWAKTDAETVLVARRRGATAALERILGTKPEGAERATGLLRRMADACTNAGRPLYSGLSSLDWPGDVVGDLWRAADLVREHRGDGHVCAWVSHGLTAIEVLLMTEAWWGLELNTYMRTRGWPADEVQSTLASLIDRGLLDDGKLTPAGTELRGAVESTTDRGEAVVVDALSDEEFDELFALLEPWAKEVVTTGGYPTDPSQLTRR